MSVSQATLWQIIGTLLVLIVVPTAVVVLTGLLRPRNRTALWAAWLGFALVALSQLMLVVVKWRLATTEADQDAVSMLLLLASLLFVPLGYACSLGAGLGAMVSWFHRERTKTTTKDDAHHG